MRKEATIRNSVAGFINRISTLVFMILVRHYLAYNLDVEYLGFEGFFQNVLGLFSLVDMGLGTAIAFDLYDPIYKKDYIQIGSIMKLYKKIYIAIGITIFLLSVLFVPFILKFINGYSVDGTYIRIFFLIYAFGVSVSYFFSYKRTLLFAMQKNHVVTNIDTIVKIAGSICQIIVLSYFQNYLLYLVLIVLMNVISNLIISIWVDKRKYYNKRINVPLTEQYKKKLTEHVKALAITNLAWQGITSTDNIIISSTVGIVQLAQNANYATIVQAIIGITNSVLGGVSASIGDLIAEGNKAKIKIYFEKYCFIYTIVSSYMALGLFYVSKPVIILWVGNEYILGDISVLLISINLYLGLNFKPIVDYQNFSGSFVYYKPYSIIALFINLVVSIVGAKLLGIAGVFLGTTITYSFMNFVVLRIVYKYVLAEDVFEYFKMIIKVNLPLVFSFFTLLMISKIVFISNPFFEMLAIACMVTFVYISFIMLILRKNENMIYFKTLLVKLIKKLFD